MLIIISLVCGLAYVRNVVSTYSSGTGAAGIFGSGLYWILRILLDCKTHPGNTKYILLICAPMPLLMLIAYIVIQKPRNYVLIDNANPNGASAPKVELSLGERIKLQPSLFKYTIPLFLVYFSEYIINQSIVPGIVVFVAHIRYCLS